MKKMPNIDPIVDVVKKGISIVDACDVTSTDAARLVNKGKKSGLVDSYISEYITKSIQARETGRVELDSSGERLGRMEKIITKVSEECGFTKPSFIYKFAKSEATKAEHQNVSTEDAINEILMRVRNIEEILLCSDKLSHWRDLRKETTSEQNKQDDIYLQTIYDAFGKPTDKEVANQ